MNIFLQKLRQLDVAAPSRLDFFGGLRAPR
jgi:hypothetical protein